MKWTEVKVTTKTESIEAISEILLSFGANGVAIEDPKDIENFQKDEFGEILVPEDFDLKKDPTVAAYFPETIFLPEVLPGIKERIQQLPSFGLEVGTGEILISEVKEASWEEAWKKYYHPVHISHFLTIVPNWEKYSPSHENEKIITLDPGMAFGTGTHPTTRLSLQALELTMEPGMTVYDVGTGSGVLSIAAKHFGAKKVTAFDLDEVAVKKAQENFILNEIAKDIEVYPNDLLKGIEEPVDVIVANILADIIIRMLPDAKKLLKENGTMILSGIIQDKEDEVMTALKENQFVVDEKLAKGDWLGLIVKHVPVD